MGPRGGTHDGGSFFTMLCGSLEHSQGQVRKRSMDETTLTKNEISKVWHGPFSLSKSNRSSWGNRPGARVWICPHRLCSVGDRKGSCDAGREGSRCLVPMTG